MNKKQLEVSAPSPVERKPTMRLSIPPGHKSLSKRIYGAKMGKRVTVEVTGKVCAFREDDYECSLELEVSGLHVDPGMGGQIDQLKEHRKVG